MLRLPARDAVIAEAQAMAAKYAKPEEMTIVVVGDKSKINDQIMPYAAKGDAKK